MEGAGFRWGKVPLVPKRTLAVIEPDGRIAVLPDCLTTEEAAGMLRCSVRNVQAMCDEGVLEEGRDWRKIWACGARGRYRISRDAVLRLLRGGGADWMESRIPEAAGGMR